MTTVETQKAEKASLRRETIRVRDSIAPEIKSFRDKEIQRHLFQTKEFINAKVAMFFASIRSEPNTADMIMAALAMNKTIVLPRVNSETRELEPYEVKGLSELVLGYMDIPEPHPLRHHKFIANSIDIIVMPGLAFDSTGGRVGYGGGYYDRFIAAINKRPTLAAIAYKEQILRRVPAMSHDISVDMIVSDSGVIYCRGGADA
ncbi:MAG: 5-formyltetrahydrofolate cyclo-ligase [Nitrospirae bacterium]|nr:5-formyltetrahydrofolate cyclo-ligase [Nitrospirota bacterium]